MRNRIWIWMMAAVVGSLVYTLFAWFVEPWVPKNPEDRIFHAGVKLFVFLAAFGMVFLPLDDRRRGSAESGRALLRAIRKAQEEDDLKARILRH